MATSYTVKNPNVNGIAARDISFAIPEEGEMFKTDDSGMPRIGMMKGGEVSYFTPEEYLSKKYTGKNLSEMPQGVYGGNDFNKWAQTQGLSNSGQMYDFAMKDLGFDASKLKVINAGDIETAKIKQNLTNSLSAEDLNLGLSNLAKYNAPVASTETITGPGAATYKDLPTAQTTPQPTTQPAQPVIQANQPQAVQPAQPAAQAQPSNGFTADQNFGLQAAYDRQQKGTANVGDLANLKYAQSKGWTPGGTGTAPTAQTTNTSNGFTADQNFGLQAAYDRQQRGTANAGDLANLKYAMGKGWQPQGGAAGSQQGTPQPAQGVQGAPTAAVPSSTPNEYSSFFNQAAGDTAAPDSYEDIANKQAQEKNAFYQQFFDKMDDQDKQFMDAYMNQPSMADELKRIREEQGLPAIEGMVAEIDRQILDTEKLMVNLEKDITARTKGMPVTESARNRLLAMESKPLSEQMDELTRARARTSAGLSAKEQVVQDILSATKEDRDKQMTAAQMQYEQSQKKMEMIGDITISNIESQYSAKEKDVELSSAEKRDKLEYQRQMSENGYTLITNSSAIKGLSKDEIYKDPVTGDTYKIPAKEIDETKAQWEKLSDGQLYNKYTGEVVGVNGLSTLGTSRSSGNNSGGNSLYGNIVLTSTILDQIGSKGGQCGTWARTQLGLPPMGNYYTEKQSYVQKHGTVGTKGLQVGDMVITSEGGEYGHALIVKGFTAGGDIIPIESNYHLDEKVSSDRVLSINSGKIYGYVRGNTEAIAMSDAALFKQSQKTLTDNKYPSGYKNWFNERYNESSFIPDDINQDYKMWLANKQPTWNEKVSADDDLGW